MPFLLFYKKLTSTWRVANGQYSNKCGKIKRKNTQSYFFKCFSHTDNNFYSLNSSKMKIVFFPYFYYIICLLSIHLMVVLGILCKFMNSIISIILCDMCYLERTSSINARDVTDVQVLDICERECGYSRL